MKNHRTIPRFLQVHRCQRARTDSAQRRCCVALTGVKLAFNGEWLKGKSKEHWVGWRENTLETMVFTCSYFYHLSSYYIILIRHFRGRHSQLIWEIPASTYEHLDSSCNNGHFQNVKNKQLSSFGCWILTQAIPDSIVREVLEANIYRPPWIRVGKPCEGFLKWGYPWVPPVII